MSQRNHSLRGEATHNQLMFHHAATTICGVVICRAVKALPGIVVCHATMVICSAVFCRTAMATGGIIFGLTTMGIRGVVVCCATLAIGLVIFRCAATAIHSVFLCHATTALRSVIVSRTVKAICNVVFGSKDRQRCLWPHCQGDMWHHCLPCHFGNRHRCLPLLHFHNTEHFHLLRHHGLTQLVVRHAATAIRAAVFDPAAMAIGGIYFGLTAKGIRGNVICHATAVMGVAVFCRLVVFCRANSAIRGVIVCHCPVVFGHAAIAIGSIVFVLIAMGISGVFVC